MVGGLGGIFVPWLFGRWWPDAPFISRTQTVIVNKTEQVVLKEKETMDRAYRKNGSAVASVTSFNGNAVLAGGSGFVVSADGLILTRRENVSAGASRIGVQMASQDMSARIVKVSEENGLVLLRVEASNLPVVSFAEDVGELTGTTVFLMGIKRGVSSLIPFVNIGAIKSVDGALVDTTIKEEFRFATGAPLIALDGNVVGIASVNSLGYVFAVSTDAIAQFLK